MTIAPERSASLVDTLRPNIHGDVLSAADVAYDDARKVWNGMIDKRPAAIVRCLGVGDVIEAVGFARDHQLPLAVRGGSHSAAGLALCDDGLVIDLTRMRGA